MLKTSIKGRFNTYFEQYAADPVNRSEIRSPIAMVADQVKCVVKTFVRICEEQEMDISVLHRQNSTAASNYSKLLKRVQELENRIGENPKKL